MKRIIRLIQLRARARTEIAENLHDGLKSQAANVSGNRELQINQLRGFFTFAQSHPLFSSTTSSLFLRRSSCMRCFD